jgi:hypothetical protein
MSVLAEHLRSPQFTDADGAPTGPSRVTFFVAPGRPRWLGYAFYLAAFVLSVVLALGVVDTGEEMGRDIFQIIGIVGAFGAIYGCWEVWRGRAPSVRGVVERLRRR